MALNSYKKNATRNKIKMSFEKFTMSGSVFFGFFYTSLRYNLSQTIRVSNESPWYVYSENGPGC